MPDDQNSIENTEPASTPAAAPAPAEPTSAQTAPEALTPPPSDGTSEPSTSSSSPKGWIWAAAAVVVIGLVVGAYFVGQSSVDEGPTSLADAAHQTVKGELPVGDINVDEITGALGKRASDILGGKSGTGNDLVDGLLNKLGKELEKGLKNGLGSDEPSGTNSSTEAFLGVSSANAPGGAGAAVVSVKAGSPAADAGLQAGDVITAVDGKAVINAAGLATQVQAHSPGDAVSITYSRNGTSAEAHVRLGNTSASGTSAPTTTTSPSI
jgi:membrane-associated protease RseP (regulator of RpoE activity)